jgi:hypothetical protein
MTIRIITLPDGVKTNAQTPTETRRYKIVGTSDQSTVNGYAFAATPGIIATVFGLLYRQDVQSSQTHYNQWMVEVTYGQRKNVTGDFTWDYDTTGGTIHITQAKQEVSRYPTATAPNQKGAIAVDGNEVKGTEIIVPALKINIQFKHPQGVVSLAYADFLADITGTTNSTTFLGFAPGRVLFLGSRGSDGTDAEAVAGYSFAVGKNQTGQTIGDIVGVAKKAWEVAWVRYKDAITVADGKDLPTREPKFVYVNRVYEEIDMAAALGFG